jgi:hypothetical protein
MSNLADFKSGKLVADAQFSIEKWQHTGYHF